MSYILTTSFTPTSHTGRSQMIRKPRLSVRTVKSNGRLFGGTITR